MAGEDTSLILGLKRGDMSSFTALFEKYRRLVFAYARGILRDDGLAEDCVQEVFLELVRKAETIDIGRGVKGWLFRVARNRSIDVLRKRSRETQSDRVVDGPDSGRTPDEALMSSEAGAGLMNAVGSLKEEEREIVIMRFFGGLTFAEAENATGVPLNTLVWRCRRALGKLAGLIKKQDDGSE